MAEEPLAPWMDWHQPCSPQAAIKVLQMVHELHRRGHHHIHATPFLRPIGTWCCSITSAAYLDGRGSIVHGAGGESREILYSAFHGLTPWGWEDGAGLSPIQMADRFSDQYPHIVYATTGRDHRYVGWFVEMLGLAEAGIIPYSFCDEDQGDPDPAWQAPLRELL